MTWHSMASSMIEVKYEVHKRLCLFQHIQESTTLVKNLHHSIIMLRISNETTIICLTKNEKYQSKNRHKINKNYAVH